MRPTHPDGVTVRRPLGLSAGTVALVLAWLGGVAIVQLTGAVAVLIMLAVGLAAATVAVTAGWWALARVDLDGVRTPTVVTQGDEFPIDFRLRSRRPLWVEVQRGSEIVASGWTDGSRFSGTAMTTRRGRIERLEVRMRSSGSVGLLWWLRSATLELEPILVAAHPDRSSARVERNLFASAGERAGQSGAIDGEIDGVRPWRDGDSDKFVHWASTLRARELVVHDRRLDADERWTVRARYGLPEPDIEAGAVRNALEQGLRSGAAVFVAIGEGEPEPIRSGDDAARWTATADLGSTTPERRRRRWWRSDVAEPDVRSTLRARWWAAATTLLSLVMLAGVLGSGPLMYAFIAGGVGVGAWASSRTLVAGEPPPLWIRTAVGVGSLLALVGVVSSTGHLDGLLEFLSGPLPQVLIVLVVLHGFECRDRRSVRVSLGVSAVVVMYAAAFRVDDRLVWWLVVWSFSLAISLATLVEIPGASPRRLPLSAGGIANAFAVVAIALGALSVVPVPDGPAALALPSMLRGESPTPVPGAVVDSRGDVRTDGSEITDGERAPAGAPGGYVGFSETMDTSVRGALSDDVVMRVRAPEPAYWRGQTFARFDGRRWFADDDLGTLVEGPIIDVPSSIGNIRLAPDLDIDEFVQTYYFEDDLPNVVFHAGRPIQVFTESNVWVRPDGAMRAATTVPDGSVYTVVSARPRVDASRLARQGHVAERLTPFGRQALRDYLEVPPTTTPETIALADQLAAGQPSTYGVVRAYEDWLAANVEYDLWAPLPDPGEDAVDDFLFDSRRGFCEQIASALTVMLRTQGVPARLTTGYIPGDRDLVTGVFEVKASDAHAWVEVWFPETGWQAFDPTATVPLSADAEAGTVGEELFGGLADVLGRHHDLVVALAASVAAIAGGVWLLRVARRRRLRGRWGQLQDRFSEQARRRGARPGAPNPEMARAWSGAGEEASAARVAAQLDRAAFDPAFDDDDTSYREARELVGSLPAR